MVMIVMYGVNGVEVDAEVGRVFTMEVVGT